MIRSSMVGCVQRATRRSRTSIFGARLGNLMKLFAALLVAHTSASRCILCLHGRGGSASAFLARGLAPLRAAASASYGIKGRARRAVAWEFDAIDSTDASGGWWSYPDGQRSFSADSYTGADESIAAVEAALATGQYCGLLGYSQGAMLAAVVAARVALGEDAIGADARGRFKFAVLASAAMPAPFRPLFERLKAAGGAPTLPTLHCLSSSDGVNPPALGDELAGCFGPSAHVMWHDGGHELPPKPRLGEVAEWMDGIM